MKMSRKSLIYTLIIYLATLGLTFGKLPSTFFQQDEWAIFSNYLYWEKANLDWFDRLLVYEQYTHLIPLSNLFSYLQFYLFGLNFSGYAWISIGMQFVNSLLIAYLALRLTGKQLVAGLAGIIFMTNSISHQAVTWTATTPGTVGAATFVLLSIIFLVSYSKSKKRNMSKLILSLLMFAFSLGFKESSVFLFPFLPLGLFVLLPVEERKRPAAVLIGGLASLGLLYTAVRAYSYLTASSPAAKTSEFTQPSLPVYLFRLLTVPLKGIVQSLFPQDFLIRAADSIVKLGYPRFVTDRVAEPKISQTVGVDIVNFVLSVVILAGVWFLLRRWHGDGKIELYRTTLFSLLLIAASVLPLILIPGSAGYFSLINGRHLYVAGIGSSVLLALMSMEGIAYIRRKRANIAPIGFLLLTMFVFLNIIKIRDHINKQVRVANERRRILQHIETVYPDIPEKSVFYSEGGAAYYGLPPEEKIMPFQSGFGNTLMVWYDLSGENFPACFFKQQYLYVLTSQSYKECGGKGFGYFREFDKLRTAVEQNQIARESIIAFEYNSTKQTLKDISFKVREKTDGK